MQYVFHTIEVYMVYYDVGICHIIHVVFLPQISKPQCFHSFIDGIRGWFVKQFWCLKMTAFSVVFHSKSMSPKIFGPAYPFVSFGISSHFNRKPPFLFCCGFYWSHSLFMRSTSCCSLTKYLNDSSPIVNYSPLTSQHQKLFLVPLIGGRWYIITQLAVYTTYIPLIYCQLDDYILPTTY